MAELFPEIMLSKNGSTFYTSPFNNKQRKMLLTGVIYNTNSHIIVI